MTSVQNEGRVQPPIWSIVVPFFNENGYLAATLNSLAIQTERNLQFVLVDNGSTDGSQAAAREFQAAHPGHQVVVLEEKSPGKASALAAGIAAATAGFTAVCDADTIYPPDYLRRARRMLEDGGPETVAALAFGVNASAHFVHAVIRAKGMAAARLMPRQCHTGGYGQCFRTAALRGVGGFSPAIWRYCLMDHEVIHRLTRIGRIGYDYRHWCTPSTRRQNRRQVRWNLLERLLYHVTPFGLRDWFFYEFLRRRFETRGVGELNLRIKEWTAHYNQAAASVLAEQSAENPLTRL